MLVDLDQPALAKSMHENWRKLKFEEASPHHEKFIRHLYSFKLDVRSHRVKHLTFRASNRHATITTEPSFTLCTYSCLKRVWPGWVKCLSDYVIWSGMEELHVVCREAEVCEAVNRRMALEPACPKSIRGLPKVPIEEKVVAAEKGEVVVVECPICADSIQGEVTNLPCGHWFHSACIEKWLSTQQASCPFCRAGAGAVQYECPPAKVRTWVLR